MRYAVVHRGALVRQQGGRGLPVMWFSSRARARWSLVSGTLLMGRGKW